MNGKIQPYSGLIALSILASSCLSTEQAAPSAERIQAAGRQTNISQLQRGRTLYLGACARCHAAEPVHRYGAEHWQQEILPAMIPLAKLGPVDDAAVRAYIQGAGALGRPVSPTNALPPVSP
jgi:mono/diheme cytochrome c family protein